MLIIWVKKQGVTKKSNAEIFLTINKLTPVKIEFFSSKTLTSGKHIVL